MSDGKWRIKKVLLQHVAYSLPALQHCQVLPKNMNLKRSLFAKKLPLLKHKSLNQQSWDVCSFPKDSNYSPSRFHQSNHQHLLWWFVRLSWVIQNPFHLTNQLEPETLFHSKTRMIEEDAMKAMQIKEDLHWMWLPIKAVDRAKLLHK